MRGLNPRQIEAFRAVVLTGGVGVGGQPDQRHPARGQPDDPRPAAASGPDSVRAPWHRPGADQRGAVALCRGRARLRRPGAHRPDGDRAAHAARRLPAHRCPAGARQRLPAALRRTVPDRTAQARSRAVGPGVACRPGGRGPGPVRPGLRRGLDGACCRPDRAHADGALRRRAAAGPSAGPQEAAAADGLRGRELHLARPLRPCRAFASTASSPSTA